MKLLPSPHRESGTSGIRRGTGKLKERADLSLEEENAQVRLGGGDEG